MKSADMGQTQSVIKYQIRGEYEVKKVVYEIKLKIPNSMLRRPSYNVSFKAICTQMNKGFPFYFYNKTHKMFYRSFCVERRQHSFLGNAVNLFAY